MTKMLADVTIPGYSGTGFKFSSGAAGVGEIISGMLKYALVFGGLAMFGYLIYGGFHLLISAGNPEGIKEGTNKIVFAIVGFLVIFAAYWIIQLVEVAFNLSIL